MKRSNQHSNDHFPNKTKRRTMSSPLRVIIAYLRFPVCAWGTDGTYCDNNCQWQCHCEVQTQRRLGFGRSRFSDSRTKSPSPGRWRKSNPENDIFENAVLMLKSSEMLRKHLQRDIGKSRFRDFICTICPSPHTMPCKTRVLKPQF